MPRRRGEHGVGAGVLERNGFTPTGQRTDPRHALLQHPAHPVIGLHCHHLVGPPDEPPGQPARAGSEVDDAADMAGQHPVHGGGRRTRAKALVVRRGTAEAGGPSRLGFAGSMGAGRRPGWSWGDHTGRAGQSPWARKVSRSRCCTGRQRGRHGKRVVRDSGRGAASGPQAAAQVGVRRADRRLRTGHHPRGQRHRLRRARFRSPRRRSARQPGPDDQGDGPGDLVSRDRVADRSPGRPPRGRGGRRPAPRRPGGRPWGSAHLPACRSRTSWRPTRRPSSRSTGSAHAKQIQSRIERARAAGAVGLIATLDWSFSHGRDWGSPTIPETMDAADDAALRTRSPLASTMVLVVRQDGEGARPDDAQHGGQRRAGADLLRGLRRVDADAASELGGRGLAPRAMGRRLHAQGRVPSRRRRTCSGCGRDAPFPSRTTAATTSTGRRPPSACCPRSPMRSAIRSRCCSTAACAEVATPSRRWPWAPAP